ncbi:MAG: FKBP-type peptidyl-prolyl cis-trans isomerase FklB [Candidatus Azotimanducaceae bacterium]|jgi:FKBP-type peptidyl-prolyl cis-trans isomerase FklB
MKLLSMLGLTLCLLIACSPTPETPNTQTQTTDATMSNEANAGQAFLEANATKDGVTVTASGLQYLVMQSGSGKTPGPTDTVRTHYHGTFIDGSVFDSSVERGTPLEFPVNGVISGWTEALQLMQEGDKWKLFVPSELAYGKRGVGPIPADTALVFEVELIEVK